VSYTPPFPKFLRRYKTEENWQRFIWDKSATPQASLIRFEVYNAPQSRLCRVNKETVELTRTQPTKNLRNSSRLSPPRCVPNIRSKPRRRGCKDYNLFGYFSRVDPELFPDSASSMFFISACVVHRRHRLKDFSRHRAYLDHEL